MLSKLDNKLFGQDIVLSERNIKLLGRDILKVVVTTKLCCSNKMISFANMILSHPNKLKHKIHMSLPGFHNFAPERETKQ